MRKPQRNFPKAKSSVNSIIPISVGVIALVVAVAFGATYLERERGKPKAKTVVTRNYTPTSERVIVQQQLPECDDGNIVGTIGGAVAGGALASNVGSGRGKTAATIGGTLGGAYLGKEYIPTKGVTCR